MATPNQVKQRAAQADDLIRRARGEVPAEPEGTEDPAAEAQLGEVEGTEQSDAEVETVLESEPEPAPEPELHVVNPEDITKQIDALRADLDQSNQRYRTLQGMIKHKDEEITTLKTLLSQAAQTREQDPEPERDPVVDHSEAKDIEEFGPEFVGMVNRTMGRQLKPLMDRLDALENTTKTVAQTSNMTRQEAFYAKLEGMIENFREINESPEFADWIQNSPTHLAIIEQAMANLDARAVADVFTFYTQLTGKGQEPAPKPAPEPASSKLEKKVAPTKGRASKPVDTPEQKPTLKMSEIAQVLNNPRRYSKEEFRRLEAEIYEAQRENRIIFDQ